MDDNGIYEDCLECGGLCCQAISLSPRFYIHRESFDLLPSYWRPISLLEAKEINPFYFSSFEEGQVATFACDHLKNGRCSIYEKRPLVCSEYPFYHGKEFTGPFYSPSCFYIAEDACWNFKTRKRN
jgi:Fe-S-cluster containining protein